MYRYKIQVKKVSGILKQSALPNGNVIVKSGARLTKRSIREKLNEHYNNKYGLIVEEFNVTGFDNDEPAQYYSGNTSSSTRIDRSTTSKKDTTTRKTKTSEKEPSHTLKVGDVLVSHWGYNRTIWSFYKVIRTTASSVVIRQLSKRSITDGNDNWYGSWEVMPIVDKFDPNWSAVTKRVKKGYKGEPCVKISSYEWAQKWDGKPRIETSD